MIYFLTAKQGDDTLVKIGFSASRVDSRHSICQVGSPLPITLAAVMSGSRQQEAELHKRFKHLHIRGEWFKADAELLLLVKDHCYSKPLARTRRVRTGMPRTSFGGESGVVAYCTPAELEQWRECATAAGLSLNCWIRQACESAATATSGMP